MTVETIVIELSTTFLSGLASSPGEPHIGVADQRWWGDNHDGWCAGGWFVMMGFMVVFWVAVAILVVWAVRSLGGRPGQGPMQVMPSRTPLEIARERYAKGEINDEEFERIRRNLIS